MAPGEGGGQPASGQLQGQGVRQPDWSRPGNAAADMPSPLAGWRKTPCPVGWGRAGNGRTRHGRGDGRLRRKRQGCAPQTYSAGAPRLPATRSPDQLSVPAEQRLGAGQQRLPIRPGQEAADGSQQEAVGRLPAWPDDLALVVLPNRRPVHVRLERGNLIFRDTASFTTWR